MKNDFYTDGWIKLFGLLPILISPFSVLGSIGIIYHVSRKKSKDRTLYHRLMFGLSCLDMLSSSWLSLGPIPTPRETGAFLARGNFTTCSALGFFWHLSVGVVLYNTFLMTSFVAMVRYNVREETISKWFEPFIHLFSILFPTITGLYSVLNDFFNPTPQSGFLICYIEPYPSHCDLRDDVECTRGGKARIYLALFMALPAIICLFIIFGSVSILWWTIRQKERQTRESSVHTVLNSTRRKQSVIYGIFFFNTYFWILLFPFIDITFGRQDTIFRVVARVMSSIFFPSQGFWNFLIFIRPRYVRVRARNMDESWFWVFLAVAMDRVTESGRTDRRSVISSNATSSSRFSFFSHKFTQDTSTNESNVLRESTTTNKVDATTDDENLATVKDVESTENTGTCKSSETF